MVVHGLIKVYFIQPNCLENMKIMNVALNKIFRMDEHHFEDEILDPINDLMEAKKSKITFFFDELIDIPTLQKPSSS